MKDRMLQFLFIFLLPFTLFAESIHIFIHVCTINHWESVFKEQMKRIKESGLYDAADSISLGVLGDGDISPYKKRYPKLNILFQTSDLSLYERPTILALHDFCTRTSNKSLVLYLHTKGVSKVPPSDNVRDWTYMMEYFLIDHWKSCVEALKKYDACGCNWWESYPSHINFFGGNFWWATSDYIKILPGYIGEGYIDPENWIGINLPKIKCFHDSKIIHYDFPYPESIYK